MLHPSPRLVCPCSLNPFQLKASLIIVIALASRVTIITVLASRVTFINILGFRDAIVTIVTIDPCREASLSSSYSLPRLRHHEHLLLSSSSFFAQPSSSSSTLLCMVFHYHHCSALFIVIVIIYKYHFASQFWRGLISITHLPSSSGGYNHSLFLVGIE